jgi:tetratricopeptide (TPR) repeat protein
MPGVRIWQQEVLIPTYGVGEQNKNPMFLEKRVYQGSSGKVYPYPVIDKIFDEKRDKKYTIVFLENEYIQVQVMPEIGGRIYRALDKTNQYDFVYYNRVIKPALVGLTGPWISGGIEFNWPQHHRPNTFGPVDYRIDDSKPDHKTIWMGERDRIYGTRMTMGITLREGAAVIEISAGLYNPTGERQSFLWWSNPAIRVHEKTQSIFPPDVYAVMDHGKRDVSRFPIATGIYYKMDYSKGVDISRYINIPVPTSYMAYHSDYDFVGGYDHEARAGILHVADHHVSPGKKQWTWGCGEFGQAWDRSLTDEDGPYIELMTGIFTDNQPDFTWLEPYGAKNFTQYFMPYKKIGRVVSASKDVVMGIETNGTNAFVQVYGTHVIPEARVVLKSNDTVYIDEQIEFSPVQVFEKTVLVHEKEQDLILTVEAPGLDTLRYDPPKSAAEKVPDPAKPIGAPETLLNTEALLLAGLHLEQYRHATYEPQGYYEEGLKRDPHDIRINNAYGNWLLRRGQFTEAEQHFRAAKESITRHNSNPFDGEVFFNLGKVLEYSGREDEAFDAYYKAVWSDAWRSQGYLKLAQISARKKDFSKALEYGREALYANYKNFLARALLNVVYRHLGQKAEAEKLIQETLGFDPLDYTSCREQAFLEGRNFSAGADPHIVLNLVLSYGEIGFYEDAVSLIEEYIRNAPFPYSMAFYMRAFFLGRQNSPEAASAWEKAAGADSAYCFPNSLEEYMVLREAVRINPKDARAYYYLGCFLYDKKRYADAREAWEKSSALDASFPTVHRNLALYYANKEHDYHTAQTLLEKAFNLDTKDSRIFYELCELYKKRALPLAEQRSIMEKYFSLTKSRDDLLVIYVEVLNGLGNHEQALAMLLDHQFHPWEGGEGKIPTLHIETRVGLAKALIDAGKNAEALEHLEQALIYYPNFGEGKLAGAQENNIYYYMGIALKDLNKEKSKICFEKASTGISEPAGAMYYNDQPPHMIYYQGLALRALGHENEAESRFNKLILYGEKHLCEKQVMDYFAVSLPDFLVFETDLDEKNKIHCYYMMGLGYEGLGDTGKARAAFQKALELFPNHYGVQSRMGEL